MKTTCQPLVLRFAARGAAMVAALLLLSGCVQVYDVKVESFRGPGALTPDSYVLSCPALAGGQADPVRDEVLQSVEGVLASRGMVPAPAGTRPTVVIEVAYGVGPRRLKAISDPRPEELWGATTYLVNGDGDSLQECTVTPVNPGALKRIVSVFEKRVVLVAREGGRGPGAPAGRELWRVDVSIEDRGEALEDALPVLAAALVEFIGTDSGEIRIRRISERAVKETALSQNS